MRLLVPLHTLKCVNQSFTCASVVHSKRRFSSKVSKPLRILFCGSDDFSCESLRALHAEYERDPGLIASIDVVCRPGKRSGRSLKRVREVPIKAVAQQLNLPIHERDTFTKWNLPKPQNESINLIIAVSFGLFVPSRILKSAEYGGLNVHPSLLPNFRGPAPLQHTIMSMEKRTGITLQTLDEITFDHGVILAQTPSPGLAIPSPHTCTYNDLLQFIKPKAADMLIQGLRDRVFLRPLIDKGQYPSENIKHAPKITKEDARISWECCDLETIFARHRALGRLWTVCISHEGIETRVLFEDFELVMLNPALASTLGASSEAPFGEGVRWMEDPGVRGAVLLDCVISDMEPRRLLRVKKITVEGEKTKGATQIMTRLKHGYGR